MGTRDQDYSLWTSMKARCRNENDKDYARYGGRGIEVCERWRNSFEDFMKDMGPRAEGLTLDRKDNDGNYEPGNCEWVDRKTQANNRSSNKHADNKSHEFDAEIFSVGTWNGDKFTVEHLDAMVRNFETLGDLVKPPVKLGHNDEQKITDGKPALGWVTALRRVGEKLIATLSDVPDVLYRAVKAGLYKRVSSEIYFSWKNGDTVYKRVLTGVALLGADIPAVSNLADLTAYLTQSTDNSGSFGKVACFEISGPQKKISNNDKDEGDNKMAENEFEKKYNDEVAAKEAAEAKAKKYKAERDADRKIQTEKNRAEREDGLKKFCEAQVKDKKMTPAGRDVIVDALKEDKHSYAHDTGFGVPLAIFEKFVATYKDVIDPTEKGKGGGDKDTFEDVQVEVDFKVKAYMDDHEKADYQTAMNRLFTKDPDLAKRYQADTSSIA